MKHSFFILATMLSVLMLAGSSCSTNDSKNGKIADSENESELRCARIFEKYLSTLEDTFRFEVVAVENKTCMVSEVLEKDASDTASRRLLGNMIFTVDLSTNEVRSFPMR